MNRILNRFVVVSFFNSFAKIEQASGGMQENNQEGCGRGYRLEVAVKELLGWHHVFKFSHPKIENLYLFTLKMVSFRYAMV